MFRTLLLSACIVLLIVPGQAQQYEDEIRKSIFFGGGSYYVDEVQIEELYHWLDSVPNLLEKYDIHLISHTDPIGGREYNEWLSRMRSEAVEQVILNRGDISERKISIKDWGLQNPVYSNQSYDGMQMNRRVDVILYPIIF
jgi:outer membrane protein OmpA-like peptidoglycan-associated protein